MWQPAATERENTRREAIIQAPGFVGRERELVALGQALTSQPAAVLVEGEAGIGKSRLIKEFLASPAVQQLPVLVATCPPFRQPHTLGPIADAARQAVTRRVPDRKLSGLAGALRPLFPEWADFLPPAPEPTEDATAARHRVFTALAELLAVMNIHALVVEDVHWADEATMEFLLYLASRQPRLLHLMVTSRPEDVPDASLLPRLARLAAGSDGMRITLGPLNTAQTANLMSSMLAGEHVSEEFAGFVHRHTDGVPFAVEESVRLMADRADLAWRRGRWVRLRTGEIAVPPTIRDAVQERAARLSPDAQGLLRATAVLASPADEATVQAVTGLSAERLRPGLSQALASGLLAEDARGLVAFRHALAARAIDETIPGPDRRNLHQRAGEALEELQAPPPAARLARHFREAGDTDRWSRYAEWAADAALAAGDEAGAGELLADLVIGARLPSCEAARLTGKIVLLALPMDGRLRELASALRSALDAPAFEPGLEAKLRFQLGRLLIAMQEFDAGRAELQEAILGLAPGSVQAVRAMMLLGLPRGTRCPGAEHLRWLRSADAASGSLKPGAPRWDRPRTKNPTGYRRADCRASRAASGPHPCRGPAPSSARRRTGRRDAPAAWCRSRTSAARPPWPGPPGRPAGAAAGHC
jgi:hypothetical protein